MSLLFSSFLFQVHRGSFRKMSVQICVLYSCTVTVIVNNNQKVSRCLLYLQYYITTIWKNSPPPSSIHLLSCSSFLPPHWEELRHKEEWGERGCPLPLQPRWSSLAASSVHLSFFFSKASSAASFSGRESFKYTDCQMLDLMPGQVSGLCWWALARLKTFLAEVGLYFPFAWLM